MRWRALTVGIIATQLIVVVLIGSIAGWRYDLPLLLYWKGALWVSITGVILYAIYLLLLPLTRKEAILWKGLPRDLFRLDLPLVAFLVCTQLALLGWLKVMMPYTVGFWADPYLANLDGRLFGGDPWIPLHALPLRLIDRVYLTWPVLCTVTAFSLAIAPDDCPKGQCLVAYFLTVASCALGQYLLPSAGPVFYEALGYGARFADLPILPWVRATANYLWITYTMPGFRVGAGISAFPSLHVAGSFWMAMVVRAYAPRLQLIAWAYWLVILIGSVYLGWHYALDGIAGSLIALFLFWLAGRLTSPGLLHRRGQRSGVWPIGSSAR